MAIDWAAKLNQKLSEPVPVCDLPQSLPVGAQALEAFFDSAPGLPPLPERLLPFTWLYRCALRDPTFPDGAEVVEMLEDAAAVCLGERKGKIWQELLESNLAELAQREQNWTKAVSRLPGGDPFQEKD